MEFICSIMTLFLLGSVVVGMFSTILAVPDMVNDHKAFQERQRQKEKND